MSFLSTERTTVSTNVNVLTQESSLTSFLTESLTRKGDNTPNFGSISRKRPRVRLTPNNLSTIGMVRSIGKSDQTYVSYSGGVEKTSTGNGSVVSAPLTRDLSRYAQSINRCTSRVNSRLLSTSVNIAQTFGERGQTVNLIATTAARLAESFRALRRGDISGCVSTLGLSLKEVTKKKPGAVKQFHRNFSSDPYKSAASFWLEIQYGWRPLLNDIYGSAKTLADRKVNSENGSFYSYHTVRSSDSLEFDESFRVLGNGDDYTAKSIKSSYKSRFAITYVVENDLLRYSAQLGLTNPALLAYELTPFSFVLDWLIPISTYLKNSQASFGLRFIQGYYSCQFTGTTSGSTVAGAPLQPMRAMTVENYPPCVYRHYERVVINSFPSEPAPTFKSPVSIGNALSAVALLVAVFKR